MRRETRRYSKFNARIIYQKASASLFEKSASIFIIIKFKMRKGRRSRSRSFSSESDDEPRGGGRLGGKRQIGLRKKSNFSSNFGE